MSAIWGMVHLDKRESDVNQGIKMEKAMDQYKLDRSLTIQKDNAVFGCGLQYITAESAHEQLPYYDEINGLFYTVDCMLDNRQELLEKLSFTDNTIPDGELLYQSYLAWEERFTDYVLGIFTFVIYDSRKNICTLFTDHTGSRSLYYCSVDKTIFFATVFSPLLAVLPRICRRINEKWIAACELTASPVMDFFPGITPFEEIHQVLAGHSITVELQGTKVKINKNQYWGMKRKKILKLKSQEEYQELFIKTLFECVQSVLRSSENTGITLSSGLDSSSVACVAAIALNGADKKLYSFTSTPLPGFKGKYSSYYITDESDGVMSICEAYSNIEPEFVQCDGKNSCTELKRIIRYLEYPHKSRQNMVWIDEIYERAAKKGCKVILKGQYGNATISQGKILNRVYDDIWHFRFRTAYHEMIRFCRNNSISRKKAFQVFLKEVVKKLWTTHNDFNDTLVRKSVLDRHKIIKAMNRYQKVYGSSNMASKRQQVGYMYDLSVFVQLGALDTRLGLHHGVVIRDPLKDIRMIELCASFPMKCFVQEGIERAAVRKYMRGIVPDTILNQVNRRGMQSADYIERLKMDWDRTRETMLEILEEPKVLHLFEKSKFENLKEEIERSEILNSENKLMNALMACSCSIFLNYFRQ